MSDKLKSVGDEGLGTDMAYTALVAFPDLEAAREFMLTQGYEVSVAKLKVLRDMEGRLPGKPGKDMFLQKRKELAPLLEKIHADDLLDHAREATAVGGLALEMTRRKLERNEYADPAKVVRDLSQVATQSVDKRMLLEERPTQIVEKRNTDEIVNSLVAMGVAKRVDVTVPPDQITEEAG